MEHRLQLRARVFPPPEQRIKDALFSGFVLRKHVLEYTLRPLP